MATINQLNEQNDRITELTNVLTHLLGTRSLCDSPITCDLFFRYVEEVKGHLEATDSDLYAQLLTHKDRRVNNLADRFMGGSKEIKRIFAQYLQKWCRMKRKELVIGEYDEFLKETHEMFELVLNRIQDEVEQLYPLIREVSSSRQRVA
jgi:succinate dehydrogenase flavin-adding protein (antitoxin of CptAB toxin-antitoxin module)